MRYWFRVTPVIAALLLAAGCGSPTGPTPVQNPPHLVCPADASLQGRDFAGAVVTFAATVQEGSGAPPVRVTCTPPSGSTFPIGRTTVQCQVIDAQQRTDSCAFSVTVAPPPVLDATRFVAFGDSITEGKGVPPDAAYPAVLLHLLASRYTTQSFVVSNRGVGGETAQAGASRLSAVLRADRPEVLLLLEGVNDLDQEGARGIPLVVDALRDMIHQARATGARVFLGTLLPQAPGNCTSPQSCRAVAAPLIAPADDRIRALAPAEGAVLVDLYKEFVTETATLVGPDGLHPTAAGYDRIATTFRAAIQAQLEAPPLLAVASDTAFIAAPGRAGTR